MSESNGKLQDELAALFDRQMSMTQPETVTTPVNYSVSQHYHHSAHATVAPTAQPPAGPTESSTLSINDVLRSHGIDSCTLSPSELDLFQNADDEQKQRLIQTWQLYIGVTSQGRPMPRTPFPAGEFEMVDCPAEVGDEQRGLAEPYMVSGYETAREPTLSLRKEPTTGEPYVSATDPVYSGQQWWQTALMGSQESQYGAFVERSRFDAASGNNRPFW